LHVDCTNDCPVVGHILGWLKLFLVVIKKWYGSCGNGQKSQKLTANKARAVVNAAGCIHLFRVIDNSVASSAVFLHFG
jgi:hypothetical protein